MMYESIAMKEMARSLASPAPDLWKLNAAAGYDCSGMDVSRHRVGAFTGAKLDNDVSSTCTNYSYIIRKILLKNINEHSKIVRSGATTDDFILRPIALLDVAMRDLQECESWPLDETERRRYERTMQCMHAIWKRMYTNMGEEQIYLLSEAMEKMEVGIANDYQILKVQISEGLRSGFQSDENRMYCAHLCIAHVCVDLPMKYLLKEFNSRIKELEAVSKNVCLMMRYFATIDGGTEADIDLNHDTMICNALRAFQNKFYALRLI